MNLASNAPGCDFKFIHISRDQPTAHELARNMGQPSAAPVAESAWARVPLPLERANFSIYWMKDEL